MKLVRNKWLYLLPVLIFVVTFLIIPQIRPQRYVAQCTFEVPSLYGKGLDLSWVISSNDAVTILRTFQGNSRAVYGERAAILSVDPLPGTNFVRIILRIEKSEWADAEFQKILNNFFDQFWKLRGASLLEQFQSKQFDLSQQLRSLEKQIAILQKWQGSTREPTLVALTLAQGEGYQKEYFRIKSELAAVAVNIKKLGSKTLECFDVTVKPVGNNRGAWSFLLSLLSGLFTVAFLNRSKLGFSRAFR